MSIGMHEPENTVCARLRMSKILERYRLSVTACSDGLGYGNNGRAALITRGLVEISRIALKLGANPLTLSGLAGMGDLVLTCTGLWMQSHAKYSGLHPL